MPDILIPHSMSVPATLGNDRVQLRMFQELMVYAISGYSRGITAGTHTIRLRRVSDDSVIGTLTWTAPGIQVTTPDMLEHLSYDETVAYDVTSLGIGVLLAQVTFYARIVGLF